MIAPFELSSSPLGKGTQLLEASAGTGKTYAITGLVLRLLLEDVVAELPQVLVVTFTVAAAEELKTRLRRALQQTLLACRGAAVADPLFQQLGRRHGAAGARRLRQALAQIDQLGVATIHGFCKRLLDECAFESGAPFHSEFTADELPLLADAARDAVREVVGQGDPLLAAVAKTGELLPDDLLAAARAVRRSPDTRLLPEPVPLPRALAELRPAFLAARDASDETTLAAWLARCRFLKGKEGPAAAPGFAATLCRRLEDPDDAPLELLLELAPSRLDAHLQKRGRPAFDLPLHARCEALQQRAEVAVHALRAELLRTLGARLAATRRRQHLLTFQDLLEQVHGALQDPLRSRPLLRAVRARYGAALIDEFQDTDPLQYEIFARCFDGRPLYLVGDPKQSIYGFRGADVHAYLRARRDAETTGTLRHNFRSHPDLVAAIDLLFGGPAAFAQDGIALPAVTAALDPRDRALRGDPGAALQLRWLPPSSAGNGQHNRDYAEPRVIADVADEIVRLLSAGIELDASDPAQRRPLAAGDCAVLARTNAQAVAIQDELRRRGVHSAIGRAGDVFRCPELDEVQRLMAALVAGSHLPTLRAAWSTVLYGLSIDDLLALDADPERLAQEIARADALRRTWVRHGFVVMFEDLLHETDGRQRLLQRKDGERKLTNYLQIAELLHHAEHDRQLAPESLLQWLDQERRHAQEIDYQLRELRLESDADAVQILTVHGSKGLEFAIVFVPFAWPGRRSPPGPLLVRTRSGAPVYDCRTVAGGQDRDGHEREELAENLRLCYVALTRAQRRCYLHWVPARDAERSALGYLLHGPGRRPDADPGTLPPPAVWAEDVKRRLPSWRDELAALAAGSGGAIAVVDLPAVATDHGAAVLVPPRCAPATPRPLPTAPRPRASILSFTTMLSRQRSAEPARELDEPDVPAATAPAEGGTPAGIFAFARGARAGICLHEILEQTLLQRSAEARHDAVRRILQRHGLLDPAAHAGPIDPTAVALLLLDRLASSPLGGLPFRLGDLHGARAEWPFFLAAGELRARDLAPLFLAHGGERQRDYAERLRLLSPQPLRGFLRGFVDLVAEHCGRHYVFDWKSNHLGDRAEDYAPQRLGADLHANDYVLQYHLYLLALHRHLGARLRGYDYDQHIGGACYVYLRGLDGEGGGIVVDRPPRGLIEAMDRWLGGAVR